MRTLVIADEYPWPENSGSRIRLLTTLRGLARCGPTELFSVIPLARRDFDPPDRSLGLDTVGRSGFDDRPASASGLLATAVRPSMPFAVPRTDVAKVRLALAEFVTGRYDLVWCFGARSWVLAGEPAIAPVVLDLYDLEDEKILARLSIPRGPSPGAVRRVRALGARLFSEEEVRRWRRLHRRAGRRARTIVVCSGLDADRAARNGVAGVSVVPNSYPRPEAPSGRVEVRSPPTLLFQGTLRYPPNAEAARYLVHEIAPALRALVSDVQIRLVGVSTPAQAAMHDPPRVALVGRVADIGAELARADLVVVPIQFGSGTRVKILEAFAQRIPVVATALGAEGLDAEDGVHLLIAETPDDFAEACARALTDLTLRERIVDNAHRLYLERYRRDAGEDAVCRVARQAVGP